MSAHHSNLSDYEQQQEDEEEYSCLPEGLHYCAVGLVDSRMAPSLGQTAVVHRALCEQQQYQKSSRFQTNAAAATLGSPKLHKTDGLDLFDNLDANELKEFIELNKNPKPSVFETGALILPTNFQSTVSHADTIRLLADWVTRNSRTVSCECVVPDQLFKCHVSEGFCAVSVDVRLYLQAGEGQGQGQGRPPVVECRRAQGSSALFASFYNQLRSVLLQLPMSSSSPLPLTSAHKLSVPVPVPVVLPAADQSRARCANTKVAGESAAAIRAMAGWLRSSPGTAIGAATSLALTLGPEEQTALLAEVFNALWVLSSNDDSVDGVGGLRQYMPQALGFVAALQGAECMVDPASRRDMLSRLEPRMRLASAVLPVYLQERTEFTFRHLVSAF